MQFLEWSILGLRSARHVLRHSERDLSITLFPMVHLAEPDFYERVYSDAEDHDVVVLEGIDSPISRRLTRSYRWISLARLGLVVQEKFVGNDVRTIHADLTATEFEELWRSGPRWERAAVEAGATVMGLWLRLTGTRTVLGRNLNTTDLPDRDTVMMWSERNAPLLDALLTARDAVLCRVVTDLLADGEQPNSVAIIYGAGHMGALVHMLFREGFRPVESEWIQVFSA
ncbi:hypothetical protein [Ruegeria sp. SCP11]|uniref:hypothetical protein n=1 Tax=Ruegeria sp. SCP11 TaxID=3141378 RepID=UPI003336DB18